MGEGTTLVIPTMRLSTRSDQIGLSLPSPRASACGMGIVHTFLTQEVSDNPAGNRGPGGTGGLGVDETYVLI